MESIGVDPVHHLKQTLIWLFFLLNSLLFLSAGSAHGGLPAAETELQDIVFVQVPRIVPERNKSDGHGYDIDGCRIVTMSLGGPLEKPVSLTGSFLSARDPSVSFDGMSILFAGKKNQGDFWQIYRMKADGSDTVQLTRGKVDHVSPLHVGTLFYLNDTTPTPQMIYVERKPGKGGGFSMVACNTDGLKPRTITFNLYSDLEPDVLPNGRLVYSSLMQVGEGAKLPVSRLMAVNIDGTDLMPFTGDQSPGIHQRMARTGFDRKLYYIESASTDYLEGGELVTLSQFRSLYSRKQLSWLGDGMYHSPCPVPGSDKMLISYQKRSSERPYEIRRIDAGSGRSMAMVYADTDYHCLDVQILGKKNQVQGRSSVVGFKYKDTGVFFCMDVYTSDRPGIRQLEPGSVKEVMITEALFDGSDPEVSQISDEVSERTVKEQLRQYKSRHRILGRAPVEKDGSFHVRIPAEIPVAFHLLDENGMALARQESWTWVMHGENRGCIGCHEDRELSPPNRFIDAVKKPEVKLLSLPDQRRSVDFRRDIMPILETRCLACHDRGEVEPDLSVPEKAYNGLIRDKESPIVPWAARKSPLLNWFFGLDSKSGLLFPQCGKGLSIPDKRRFVEWVNLGAPYRSPESVLNTSVNRGEQ